MDKEFPTIVCQMEEDEGGRDRSSGKKNNNKKNRGAGGLQQHVYVCISALDLVIRRRKNQLPPNTLWGPRMHYLFSGSANIP